MVRAVGFNCGDAREDSQLTRRGSTTIYINTPGTHTLTHDIYENIIVSANVKIVGNNFTIHGDHNKAGNTIGILSSGEDIKFF